MKMIQRIIGVLQGRYFALKMRFYGLLGLPAQNKMERQLFKEILESFKGKKIRIFEWGSGFSSIYFGRYLQKRGLPFEWHSIDNNKIWHEKVKAMAKGRDLDSQMTFYLEAFPPFWEKPGWKTLPVESGAFAPQSDQERAYIDFPARLHDKFDIVFIDARFRRRCLQTARTVVAADGVVIMHDAQKAHYHPGMELFPFRTFISSGTWYPLQSLKNKVWVGSQTKGRVAQFTTSHEG